MGWLNQIFRRKVEVAAESAVQDFFNSERFKNTVRAAYMDVIREPRFAWFRFVKLIQWHLQKADRSLSDKRAFALAREVYLSLLRDERIKFGDPRYAWDSDGALSLTQSYEIDHWEHQP